MAYYLQAVVIFFGLRRSRLKLWGLSGLNRGRSFVLVLGKGENPDDNNDRYFDVEGWFCE
jgi:hypothetical protein